MPRYVARLLPGIFVVTLAGCGTSNRVDPLDDEAMVRARTMNLTAEQAAYDWYYPKKIHNYFAGMDGAIVLPDNAAYQLLDVAAHRPPERVTPSDPITTEAEILGRNTWMMWAAGNEGFWDWLGRQFGFVDLLRVLD